jgi:hypothetical protein
MDELTHKLRITCVNWRQTKKCLFRWVVHVSAWVWVCHTFWALGLDIRHDSHSTAEPCVGQPGIPLGIQNNQLVVVGRPRSLVRRIRSFGHWMWQRRWFLVPQPRLV